MAARKHPASTNRLASRKKPRLKMRPVKPNPRWPEPMRATKPSPPANNPPTKRRTNSTICFSPTLKSLVRPKQVSRTPGKRASLQKRFAASKVDANAPADAPAESDTAAAVPQTQAAPVISIESDVDPETGLNMAAGTGRITRSSTVPLVIRTNSSTLGSF